MKRKPSFKNESAATTLTLLTERTPDYVGISDYARIPDYVGTPEFADLTEWAQVDPQSIQHSDYFGHL